MNGMIFSVLKKLRARSTMTLPFLPPFILRTVHSGHGRFSSQAAPKTLPLINTLLSLLPLEPPLHPLLLLLLPPSPPPPPPPPPLLPRAYTATAAAIAAAAAIATLTGMSRVFRQSQIDELSRSIGDEKWAIKTPLILSLL